jgi:hypothetical protein
MLSHQAIICWELWRPAATSRCGFAFQQYPAFSQTYDRNHFCFLNEYLPEFKFYPFPDMKNESSGRVIQVIRSWAGTAPCRMCGVTLIRRMPDRFYCHLFQKAIAAHTLAATDVPLPPAGNH